MEGLEILKDDEAIGIAVHGKAVAQDFAWAWK